MDKQKQDTVLVSENATVLDGRYELLEKLGSGGMGAVYMARQLSTSRLVAVKFVAGDAARDQIRFKNEAKTLSELTHPNIVSVIDYGIDGEGRQFLVMEHIAGISLDKLFEERKHLGTDTVLEIFTQVLRALVHAHAAGIVHRDLKPSNVMITEEPDGHLLAKVVDFGIAKEIQGGTKVTQTGDVIGTPAYMSPEQAMGFAVDPRTDIFSVGCMMYESITGRLPFTGENAFHMVVQRVNEDAPSFPTDCDKTLEPVVMKALARDKENRFASAAEMLAALAAPHTVAAPKKARRSLDKRIALSIGAAVVALLIVGGMTVGKKAEMSNSERIAQARVYLDESDLKRGLNDMKAAREHLLRAKELFGADANKLGKDMYELNLRLGIIALNDRDFANCERYFDQAMVAANAMSDLMQIATLETWQANSASVAGDHKRSAELFKQSLEKFDTIPNTIAFRGANRWHYAAELATLKQYSAARTQFQKARVELQQSGQLQFVQAVDIQMSQLPKE